MPAAAKVENSNFSGDVNTKVKMPVDNNMTHMANCAQDPTKIANTIIDKKIRNLEKRKVRLLEMKAMEDKGQKLEPDQKNAIKKLDSVVEMVDMLKEISKNVSDSLNDFAKQQKKQQKKEQQDKQMERQQNELERVKLWLKIHFVASRFPDVKKNLQDDSLKLEENQLQAIEKFAEVCSLQAVKSVEENAEKLNLLMDGAKKEFVDGITYFELKEVLTNLVESDSFEKALQSSEVGSHEESQALSEEKPLQVDTTGPMNSDSKGEVSEEPAQQQASNVDLKSQLGSISFMRDPIAETELQHKDPAVVASGFAYQPQLAQPALPTSTANFPITSNSNMPIFPAVTIGSIPTQTFTNQTYAAFLPNETTFIPVTIQNPIPHPMNFPVDQSLRNVVDQNNGTQQPIKENGLPIEGKPLGTMENNVSENSISFNTSQESDATIPNNVVENGISNVPQHKRNGLRNGRGNMRHFNNNNPPRSRSNGKFVGNYNNSRPTNRPNGNRHGAFRNDRNGGPIRNHLNNNNHNQGQNAVLASK